MPKIYGNRVIQVDNVMPPVHRDIQNLPGPHHCLHSLRHGKLWELGKVRGVQVDLRLSVIGMVHRVRIEEREVVRVEQEDFFPSLERTKKVLLLVEVAWRHISLKKSIQILQKIQLGYFRLTSLAYPLPNQQQVGGQRSPVELLLVLRRPRPVELDKVRSDLRTHGVVQRLL